MRKKLQARFIFILSILLLLSSCALIDDGQADVQTDDVTPISELAHTDIFREGALEHILEGELNKRGQAVGYHYDQLPSKKGEIIQNTQTPLDENGVYEAEVEVEGVLKQANRGKSSFFPDAWDTQDVVDAINDAYENRTFISGNTYEGLTEEGMIIRMYLDQKERIISAFPVYEGGGK